MSFVGQSGQWAARLLPLLMVACGAASGDRDADPVDGSPESIDGATDAATSDAATSSSLCQGEAGGGSELCAGEPPAVSPVGTSDIAYQQWSTYSCFGDACLCETAACEFMSRWLACDAVEGGYWWGLGAEYVRVQGRQDGRCIFDVGSEVEGFVGVYRCEVPLPMVPWAGLASDRTGDSALGLLSGVEDNCEFVGGCSAYPDGPDPCFESALDPPLCPPAAGLPCDP